MNSEASLAPVGRRIRWLGTAALGLGAVLAFAVSFAHGDAFKYTLWADRDLLRAIDLFREFQFGGPELNSGGQTPGGFYYYLLRLLLVFSEDPLALHRFALALNGAALIGLFALARRYTGLLASVFAVAFFIASRPRLDVLWTFTNPAFTPLLSVAAYWLIVRIVVEEDRGKLPWLVLLLMLTAQIHMSFLILIPAVILAMALHRVWPRPRDVLWSVAAVAAAIGPYVVHEIAAGFPNQAAMSEFYQSRIASVGDLLVRYVETAAYTFFNYHTPEFAVLFGQPRKFAVATAATIFFPAVFVWFTAACVHRLVAGGAGGPDLFADDRQRRLVATMYVVLIVGTVATLATGVLTMDRRIQFLQPAALLIGAVAVDRIFDHLLGPAAGRRKMVAAVALLGLAAATTVWNSGVLVARWPYVFPMYRDTREIAETLRSEFALGRRDLETKVVALSRDAAGRWEPAGAGQQVAWSYLIRGAPEASASSESAVCVAVLAGEGDLSPADIAAALAALPAAGMGLAPGGARRAGRFTYVGYTLAAGNCFRSFNNRYLATPEERQIRAHRARLAGGEVVVLGDRPGFLARLGDRLPVDVRVELVRDPDGLHAVLHSQQLRGYNGIAEERLEGLRLVLERAPAGAPVTLMFHDGLIGGRGSVIITPWRTPTVAVAPGRYRIRLRADRFVTRLRGESGGTEIVLADAFAVE